MRQKAYQAFGDLEIEFPDVKPEQVTGYRRSLEPGYRHRDRRSSPIEGVTYRREVFASYPAKAIVVRLTASRPGARNYTAQG